MFQKLVHDWKEERGLGPREVAVKVKRFYHFYAINRHKMTTLTPALRTSKFARWMCPLVHIDMHYRLQ